MTYLEQIEKLCKHGTLIGTQDRGSTIRWLYKFETVCGTLCCKLYQSIDKEWYDYCEYRQENDFCWTMSKINKLYDIVKQDSIIFTVYSFRYYGEPKLSKPKELKGIKPIGSATYIPKHCSPQVFVKGNDVWIKHTDYMSAIWKPPLDDFGKDTSYYLNKYFGINRGNKFIYADNWGSIVLRNEAWLLIENFVPVMKYVSEDKMAYELCRQQQLELPCREWYDFWIDVYRCVKENSNERK